MIKNMKAIDYNLFKTIIKLVDDRIKEVAKEYNIRNTTINVLPAYPSDLTALHKPSIIVRRVDAEQSKIGFGNVLGQYFDDEIRGYTDVVGKRYDAMLQFDVVTSTNSDRLLIGSMIREDIFNDIEYNNNGRFDLYDYTSQEVDTIGHVQLIGDSSMTDVIDKDSSNDYYVGAIRQSFALIQTTVPKREYVDLSKWIKQTYKIIV